MPKEILGMHWKTHTPNLIKEIAGNPNCSILRAPLMILGGQLFDVAERARKLNDPILNKLMCDLTLFTVADPNSKDYNKESLQQVYKLAKEAS